MKWRSGVTNTLADDLLDTGLLQFGLFNGSAPCKLSLEMLPSYPDVLRRLVADALSKCEIAAYSRLLSVWDVLPFAVALGLESDVPVVYSQGSDADSVFDLIGAYDVGHPALLVVNIWRHGSYDQLINRARHVGLEITGVLAVISLQLAASNRLEVTALLPLSDTIRELVRGGKIPPQQAQAVQTWLEGM
jgi:hypothetical protein